MNNRSPNNNHVNNNKGFFICGVVEGFYGKPWTWNQRKELFKNLKDFKLNSFLYAPKDDAKHRAKWRQLYSDQEASELRVLIAEARANDIHFYYSLAPGLDMVYSDPEEMNHLIEKYNQLVSLGCESFAILFDDIEPVINDKDQQAFKNYAAAQVHVTNTIYEHLNRPKFLFCPTEYCQTRALPSVSKSTYLNTIGVGLHEGIDIMWSGSSVISRYITEESIEALSLVIRRPPVIWENLHANDYDKRRVFLGPYSGRSPKIISRLRGVLTNPNCEYEANYIAIHTLAQWSKCTEDVTSAFQASHSRAVMFQERCDNINETGVGQDTRAQSTSSVYDPHRALALAIRDWLPRVLETRSLPTGLNLPGGKPEHIYTPQIEDSKSDELALNETKLDKEVMNSKRDESVLQEANAVEMVHEEIGSESANSPGANDKNEMDTTESPITVSNNDNNSCDSCKMQEDVAVANGPSKVGSIGTGNATTDMQSNSSELSGCLTASSSTSMSDSLAYHRGTLDESRISVDNLSLLVDLYYLPFEHGVRGKALLDDIKWLRDHGYILIAKNLKDHESIGKKLDLSESGNNNEPNSEITMKNEDEEDQEQDKQCTNIKEVFDPQLLSYWLEKAERLNELCACISELVNTLIYDCPNKLLIVELYPYLAETRDAMVLILDYVKYLRHRCSRNERFYYATNNLGWSKQNKEYQPEQQFEQQQQHQQQQQQQQQPQQQQQLQQPQQQVCTPPPCDDEPWVHRGGLIGEVQRLLSC